jgi:hypothetical protein
MLFPDKVIMSEVFTCSGGNGCEHNEDAAPKVMLMTELL